jgi:type I restriction enzyme S subunit
VKPSLVPLGEIVEIPRDSVAPDAIRSGTNYVGLENITGDGGFSSVGTVDRGELASTKFLFTPKHILYGKLRPYLRKIARPNFSGICSTDILPILPGPKVDRDFLAHFLRLDSSVAFAESRSVGINLPRISPSVLSTLEVPLPPLKEQRRIAAILDKVDALRQKRSAALQKLNSLTQSLFLDMFGDLTQKGVREITFEELALSGRGMFTNGPFGSDLLTCELRDTGVPVLYIRDIRNAEFVWKSNVFVTPEKATTLPSCQVRSGDLLIAKVGDPPGAAALYPYGLAPAIITQDVIRARINEQIANPAFLQHYLNSTYGKHLIQTITVDGTRSRFSLRDLKGLKIPIPPLELQQIFAARVKRIFPLHQMTRENSTVLCQCFSSLQDRAFRGEL